MFEDFFNVVKKRWGDGEEEYKPPMFKCPRCQGTSPLSKYEELHRVCPKCSYHGRLSSQERIAITVDKDSFKEFNCCGLNIFYKALIFKFVECSTYYQR